MTFLQEYSPLGVVAIIAKVTLLLLIGWGGALLLRRAAAVARHLVWLTVIAGVLLIPVLARIAPVSVPLLPRVMAPTSSRVFERSGGRATTAPAAIAPSPLVVEPAGATPAEKAPNVGTLAVVAWAAITVVLLLRFIAGVLSVNRIIRRARAVTSPEWTRALADAAKALNVTELPRLVMSDQVEMAFAFDLFAPAVIVPVSAHEWSEDRRRAVLLHELAHIRRRDLIGHALASIACAVYWFNPFVWAAARRLRVESELASDDVVLESGVRPSDYAQHLLDMVTSFGQRTPTVALAMARPQEFEGRLVAILDRANRRTVLGRVQRGGMVGVFGLLTLSIAAVVPVPRLGKVESPVVSAPQVPALSPIRDSLLKPAMTRVAAVPPTAPVEPASTAPPLTDVAIGALLEYGTAGIVNPMIMILRSADSLGLDGRQADSIATLNRAYMVRLNAIWSPVSDYYLLHRRGANDAFREAPRESMSALIGIVPHVVGLLTPEQRGKLPAAISTYLDSKHLAEIATGSSSDSRGVFLPDWQLLGGGARRGGGRRGR